MNRALKHLALGALGLSLTSNGASRECQAVASEAEVQRFFGNLVDETSLAFTRRARSHEEARTYGETRFWDEFHVDQESLRNCAVALSRGEQMCRQLVASRPKPTHEEAMIKNDIVKAVQLAPVVVGAAVGSALEHSFLGPVGNALGVMIGSSAGFMATACMTWRMMAWERARPQREVESLKQKYMWEPLRKQGIRVPKGQEDLWFQTQVEGIPFSTSALKNRQAILAQRKKIRGHLRGMADSLGPEDRHLAEQIRQAADRADQFPTSRLPLVGTLTPLRDLVADTVQVHRAAHRLEEQYGLTKRGLHLLDAYPTPPKALDQEVPLMSHDLWSSFAGGEVAREARELRRHLSGRVWTSDLQRFVDEARKRGFDLHLDLPRLSVTHQPDPAHNLPGRVEGELTLRVTDGERPVETLRVPVEFAGGEGRDPFADFNGKAFQSSLERSFREALEGHAFFTDIPRRLPARDPNEILGGSAGACADPLGRVFR